MPGSLQVLPSPLAGVRSSRVYFEVAENYGVLRWQLLTRIILPAGLPLVFTGIRIALGTSLIVVVGVECVSVNYGIGAMIWNAWETFEIEKLCVGIFLCALMSLLFNVVLKKAKNGENPGSGIRYTLIRNDHGFDCRVQVMIRVLPNRYPSRYSAEVFPWHSGGWHRQNVFCGGS